LPQVIVVDDEVDVLGTIGRAIQRDNIEVQLVNNSVKAESIIKSENPDLAILDIIMPDVDGITICRRLRSDPKFVDLPILFLTAKGRTDDIVAGLDAGADDYVIKPFHIAELRARVDALLRRGMQEVDSDGIIAVGDLVLDSKTHQVSVSDENIQLTSTEHLLLRYLMTNAGEPQSPSHLLEAVWDYPPDTGDPDLVRAHIRNVRAKLRKSTGDRFIETVHSVGYIIEG